MGVLGGASLRGVCHSTGGGVEGIRPGLSNARRSGAEQSFHRVERLVDFFVTFAAVVGLHDAVTEVFVEQAEADILKCLGDGRDLGQHVDAVLVVIDHPLDTPYLPFDPGQPAGVIVLVERVPAHVVPLDRR